MSTEEQKSNEDVHIAPEREDRFRWNSVHEVVWLDQVLNQGQEEEPGEPEEEDEGLALALEDDESEEEEEPEEGGSICQGPFWPSPDDPDTGYCTCCEQAYYGDLLNHSCLSDEGEMEDDDEDAEERPVLKL